MKLDPIHQCALVDRAGMRGTLTQRLAVGLAGPSHVGRGHCGERDQLDCIDLDLTRADSITTTGLHLRLLPEPDRERDISRQNVIARSRLNSTAVTLPAERTEAFRGVSSRGRPLGRCRARGP